MLCLRTLNSDAKFEEKLALGSENNMRNLVSLIRALASLKICTLMWYICRKYIVFEPKKYKGVMCMTLKNVEKFEECLTCALRNGKSNLVKLLPNIQNSQNLLFNWFLLS